MEGFDANGNLNGALDFTIEQGMDTVKYSAVNVPSNTNNAKHISKMPAAIQDEQMVSVTLIFKYQDGEGEEDHKMQIFDEDGTEEYYPNTPIKVAKGSDLTLSIFAGFLGEKPCYALGFGNGTRSYDYMDQDAGIFAPTILNIQNDTIIYIYCLYKGESMVLVNYNDEYGTITGWNKNYVRGQNGSVYAKDEKVNLTAVADEDYEFVRWDNGCTTAKLPEFTATKDTIMTAIFAEKQETVTYTITFDPDNGEDKIEVLTEEGQIPEAPATDPVKDADERYTYTFSTWGNLQPATKDTTYIAQYTTTPVLYTVTFRDYDGTQIGEVQEVEYGNAATAPATPERTGYTFKQWDTDFTNVTENLTVTAEYDINLYTVTIYAENGTVVATDADDNVVDLSEKVEYNTLLTLTATPAEGYKFDGWSDGTQASLPAVRQITVTEDIVLTATFSKDINTGLDEFGARSSSPADRAVKIIENNHLYILLPDGTLFDSTGKQVRR